MRQRKLVLVSCDFCEKLFQKRSEELSRTLHSFCSFECHGKFITQQAEKRSDGGFSIGDDVILRFTKRGRAALGIVNGFGREPGTFRVIRSTRSLASKEKMRNWLLLKEVDLVAFKELSQIGSGI